MTAEMRALCMGVHVLDDLAAVEQLVDAYS